MKRSSTCFFVSFSLIFALSAAGEEWRNFSNAGSVSAIARHKDTLWIGTLTGLVRYNKKTRETAHFTKINSPLPMNAVQATAADARGNVWAGLAGRGLVKYGGNAWTLYRASNSPLPSDTVTALAFDSAERLWIGTSAGAVVMDAAGNWNSLSTSPAFGKPVSAIAPDSAGGVWIGTRSKWVFHYDGFQWKTDSLSPGNRDAGLLSLCADTNGSVWVGTYQGLYRLRGGALTSYGQPIPVFSLAKDNRGTLWTGYSTMLGKYDIQSDLFDSAGVPPSRYGALLWDSDGLLWTGSSGMNLNAPGGFYRIDGAAPEKIDLSNSKLPFNKVPWLEVSAFGHVWAGTSLGAVKFDGFSQSAVTPPFWMTSFAVDKSGEVWAGTQSLGLQKYDGRNWTVFNTSNSGIPSNDVALMLADDSGNLWMNQANLQLPGALARFDGGSGWSLFDTLNSSLPTRYVQCVHRDRRGIVWVGTDGGLSRFDGRQWLLFDPQNSPLPYNAVLALASDNKGNLWVGSGHPYYPLFPFGGGAARFDGSSWKTFDTLNSGLPSNIVTAIATEENGTVWFGTDKGLARYNGTSWQAFNESNSGLSQDHILSVAVDSIGNKWIGTWSGGLFVYNENKISIGAERAFRPAGWGADLALYSSPNPFRRAALIDYRLPAAGRVSVRIFDAGGRVVQVLDQSIRPAGAHRLSFEAGNLANGVYLCRLSAGGKAVTRRLLLAR